VPMDWQHLTGMTRDQPFVIERVRLTNSSIAIEGAFELPPLARLAAEDQVFVAAFVASHGSIKEMERLFGVSYPTIKNRLRRISEQLDFVHVKAAPPDADVLDRLERGDIDVATAVEMLRS